MICPSTLLNAVTATGAGAALQVNPESMRHGITWQTASTGTPTAITINLEGSIDGAKWATLDSSTSTAGEVRHVVNKPVNYLRANLATLTGGTAPTVTVKAICA